MSIVRVKDGLATEDGFKGFDNGNSAGEADRYGEVESPEPKVGGVSGRLKPFAKRISTCARNLSVTRVLTFSNEDESEDEEAMLPAEDVKLIGFAFSLIRF